jgi:hypothetical protein
MRLLPYLEEISWVALGRLRVVVASPEAFPGFWLIVRQDLHLQGVLRNGKSRSACEVRQDQPVTLAV